MQKPIVVLIGPSGAGKSTIASQLALHKNPTFYIHKKYTTRPPRPNETNESAEDIFVSQDEFAALQKSGELLHVVQPFGQPHLYGIKALPQHDKNISLVLLRSFVVDTFKKFYPNIVIYQLSAPVEVLASRMNNRLQNGQDIASRLASAKQELQQGKQMANRTFITGPTVVKQIIKALELDVANAYNTDKHNQ